MKKRNSTWGCPQIADRINLAFGTSINKDVVRRILALHYQPAECRIYSCSESEVDLIGYLGGIPRRIGLVRRKNCWELPSLPPFSGAVLSRLVQLLELIVPTRMESGVYFRELRVIPALVHIETLT